MAESFIRGKSFPFNDKTGVKQQQTLTLIETESDALFLHWRRMAAITLEAEPLDLCKLEFCVKRMRYWEERMSEKAKAIGDT